jgi:1,3-beta-glucan synthase
MVIVWLRPSKQIRAPLYSMKVRKQRRWMVIKYGVVYAMAASGFAALIVLRTLALLFLLSLF